MKFVNVLTLSLFLFFGWMATANLAAQEGLRQKSKFNVAKNSLEHGPGLHDSIHCLVGGTMCSARSSNDPVFFTDRAVLEWVFPPLQAYGAAANVAANVVGNSNDPGQIMGFFSRGLHNNGAFRADINLFSLIPEIDKSSPKIAHGMYRDRGKSSPKIAH